MGVRAIWSSRIVLRVRVHDRQHIARERVGPGWQTYRLQQVHAWLRRVPHGKLFIIIRAVAILGAVANV